MKRMTTVDVIDHPSGILESAGGRHHTPATTKAGGAHDLNFERQERCEGNSIHVTTQQTQYAADAAPMGVRLRTMRPGRSRYGPRHQAQEPLSALPVEPARGPSPGRQASGVQRTDGADRHHRGIRRRVVSRAPMQTVRGDTSQPYRRR